MSEQLSPVEDEQRSSPASTPELLDVFGDECSRRILVATSERPMTVKELTDRCPVSSTTVYRRINTLVDHGLLSEKPAFPTDGTNKKFYEATVDRVETLIDEDGFSVRTFDGRSERDRIVNLISGVPSEQVRATVEDGELHLRVPLNGTLFGGLTGEAATDGSGEPR